MTPEAFGNLLRSEIGPLEDVQFVYEGTVRALLPGGKDASGHDAAALDEDYQGNYAFRMTDGSLFLEVYHQRSRNNDPLRHTIDALLGNKLEVVDRTPDHDRRKPPPVPGIGGPATLNVKASPNFFVYYWNLRRLIDDIKGWGFEDQGWETVEGRRCLRVQFDEMFGADMPNRPVTRLWFDLERGCLPLKIESWRGKVLNRRTHDILLKPFSLPSGKDLWFPVRGITDTFSRKEGEASDGPYFHEECHVVVRSLRFNQGLKDDVFSAGGKGPLPKVESFLEARREYEKARDQPEKKTSFRTDPAGVAESLEANLAEADRQAKALEASSVAREPWPWHSVGRIAFVLIAAALLIGALILRKRGR